MTQRSSKSADQMHQYVAHGRALQGQALRAGFVAAFTGLKQLAGQAVLKVRDSHPDWTAARNV